MKKIQTDNLELSRVQDYAAEALEPIEECILIDGVLLKSIPLVTGKVNLIAHKLGRRPIGYIVVGQDADASVWQSASKLPDRIIALNTSNNVTVNIWVL